MESQKTTLESLLLDVEQQIEIKAAPEKVYRAVLHRLGEGSVTHTGESMNMKIEEAAGGRWYRDRGNGIVHLWGHVQVLKPPVLIELSGPMFMSYPAINHVEVRLEEVAGGTRVRLRHRAIGMITEEHRSGVSTGWRGILDGIAQDCAA